MYAMPAPAPTSAGFTGPTAKGSGSGRPIGEPGGHPPRDTPTMQRLLPFVLTFAALAAGHPCACAADGGYSIVAQSTRATAATGRRPIGERIASANLPDATASHAAAPAGRQARASSSGNGLRSSRPSAVTR